MVMQKLFYFFDTSARFPLKLQSEIPNPEPVNRTDGLIKSYIGFIIIITINTY